jgi:nicotinamidase-related amidase
MESLILVDLQNDYFRGGSMELVGAEQAAANARRLLNSFRGSHAPVIHIRHLAARPGATFFLPGSRGAEINEMVAPLEDEEVMVKHYPNSFRGTRLLEVLRDLGTSDLVICGAMSHMCIDATVRAAFDLGFNCTVAEDACATRDLPFNDQLVRAADVHAAFMAALSAVYAKVLPAEAIVRDRG